MTSPLPTQERLRELFSYEAGRLIWVNPPQRRPQLKGTKAGTINGSGYEQIWIDKRCYRTHRLVWKLHHGTDPAPILDHIDGNRLNNRIENLQELDQRQNVHKGRMMSNKRSGLPPCVIARPNGKFQAAVTVNGKRSYLGTFATVEEAVAARDAFLARVNCLSSNRDSIA